MRMAHLKSNSQSRKDSQIVFARCRLVFCSLEGLIQLKRTKHLLLGNYRKISVIAAFNDVHLVFVCKFI